LAEADLFYRSGDQGMLALAWRCSFSIRTARSVYSAIGARLRDMDYDPLRGRAIVPRHRKAVLVAMSFGHWMAEVPPRGADRLRTTPRPAAPPKRILSFPHDVLPLSLSCEPAT
jgi:phytoene synthase